MGIKNILLMCGGGHEEHDVSLTSAEFIWENLNQIPNINPYFLVIEKDGSRKDRNGNLVELRKAGELFNHATQSSLLIDFFIPCFHGAPGENGQVQALYELMGVPFLGGNSESCLNCFNKITTKLWLKEAGIPVTKFILAQSNSDIKKAQDFFIKNNNDIYIKASNQGSSVGCYHVTKIDDVEVAVKEALKFSSYAVIEETCYGRELEVAVFEFENKLHATKPGEVICPDHFYSYQEKYNENSKTSTKVVANGLSCEIENEIRSMAKKAFTLLNLKDMARVDFFLSHNNLIYINEINTFPGHTKISLFPTMLENYGPSYKEYLEDRIHKHCK